MASKGVFQHLYSTAELAALSTRERNRYERSLKNYRDMLADKDTTKARIKEAIEEGVYLVASNMKKMGMQTDVIIKCTNLTKEQIESL